MVAVFAVCPVGSYFVRHTVYNNRNRAVLYARGHRLFKEGHNRLGLCRGGNIEIVRGIAVQHIAHAAAHGERFIAVFLQSFNNIFDVAR